MVKIVINMRLNTAITVINVEHTREKGRRAGYTGLISVTLQTSNNNNHIIARTPLSPLSGIISSSSLVICNSSSFETDFVI